MGTKISDICEMTDDGKMFCSFPEKRHDTDVQVENRRTVDTVKLSKGTSPDKDISVV